MDQPLSNYPPKTECFLHLIALKYLLAGDLESIEPLELLDARRVAIDWSDPKFIEFSEELRAGVPKLTSEQEATLRGPLLHLVQLLIEKNSEGAEIIRSQINPDLESRIEFTQRMQAQYDELKKTVASDSKRATRTIEKLTEMHVKMRDHLEMLNADITPYEIDFDAP
jgi:hypothetical protein